MAPNIVDDGERLVTLQDASQDFAVANALIGHCPDRHDGIAVQRPATPFVHVQRDHEHGPASLRRSHYLEWRQLVDARLASITAEHGEAHARDEEPRFYSIHFHLSDRTEFGGMLERACGVYELPVEVELVGRRHEFMAVLGEWAGGPA